MSDEYYEELPKDGLAAFRASKKLLNLAKKLGIKIGRVCRDALEEECMYVIEKKKEKPPEWLSRGFE